MKKKLVKGFVGLWMCIMLLPVCVHAAAEQVDDRKLDHNRRLLHAADNGDIVTVKSALSMKADVDIRNGRGFTPLMFAARKGYEYVVTALIQAKAQVNAESYDQATPLWLAVKDGRTNAAEILVDAGADMNTSHAYIEDGKGMVRKAALLTAIEVGDPVQVRMLLEKKADVNQRDVFGSHETALMLAVARNRVGIIPELIYADADVTCTDMVGKTVQDYMKASPQWVRRLQWFDNVRTGAAAAKSQRPAREKAPFTPLPALGEITSLDADDYKPHKVAKSVSVLRGASREREAAVREVDLPLSYAHVLEERYGNGGVSVQKKQVMAAAQEVYAMQHAAAEAAKQFARKLAAQELYGKTAEMVGKAHRVVMIECPICTYHNQEQAQELHQQCDMCGMRLQV